MTQSNSIAIVRILNEQPSYERRCVITNLFSKCVVSGNASRLNYQMTIRMNCDTFYNDQQVTF